MPSRETLSLLLGALVLGLVLTSAWWTAHPQRVATLPQVQTGFRVSINTAGVGELAALPGVGPAIAANIVSHRAEHGHFRSPTELENVRLIGPMTRARIEPFVRFEDP